METKAERLAHEKQELTDLLLGIVVDKTDHEVSILTGGLLTVAVINAARKRGTMSNATLAILETALGGASE